MSKMNAVNSIHYATDVFVFTYEITFTYTTIRGNKKERSITLQTTQSDTIKDYFYDCIDAFNKKKPYRAYLDTQIIGEPKRINVRHLYKHISEKEDTKNTETIFKSNIVIYEFRLDFYYISKRNHKHKRCLILQTSRPELVEAYFYHVYIAGFNEKNVSNKYSPKPYNNINLIGKPELIHTFELTQVINQGGDLF